MAVERELDLLEQARVTYYSKHKHADALVFHLETRLREMANAMNLMHLELCPRKEFCSTHAPGQVFMGKFPETGEYS